MPLLQCFLVDAVPSRMNTKPGMMWYLPDLWDPAKDHLDSEKRNYGYLSENYFKDWSSTRPPLCVVCPNGQQWTVDANARDKAGWAVIGTAPNITCYPSILVGNYHGFLKEGVFTNDLEGRKY